MNNKFSKLAHSTLQEALSLVADEHETVREEELKQRYDGVIKKLQSAIKQFEE